MEENSTTGCGKRKGKSSEEEEEEEAQKMALKLNVINFQSQKYPSFSLPPMASIRSPKLFMASAALGSQTK